MPLVNVGDRDCPACRALGRAYTSALAHDAYNLDKGPLRGEYARTLAEGLELSVIDMILLDDMTLAAGPDRRNCRLGITCCLEGGMRWQTREGREISLATGHLLLGASASTGVCRLTRGQKARFVDLAVNLDGPLTAGGLADIAALGPRLRQAAMTPRIRAVVADIVDGRPDDALRALYCRGKAHELLALVLDQVARAGRAVAATALPGDWVRSLMRAKETIDADIANAPSLAQLSRCGLPERAQAQDGLQAALRAAGARLHHRPAAGNGPQAAAARRHHRDRGGPPGGLHGAGALAVTFRKRFGLPPSEVLRNATPLR
jgi:hypothetical protein